MQSFTVPLSAALMILDRQIVTLVQTGYGYQVQHFPNSKFGVTFTLKQPLPTDQPSVKLVSNQIKRLDVHAIKYNSAVRRLVQLCQSKSIKLHVYDSFEDWHKHDVHRALSHAKVIELTAQHTDKWWHEKYDRLLADWAELLYHHTSDQLSKSASRTLARLKQMGTDDDVIIAFDMVANEQSPSVADYRTTMLINRQLDVHAIESYPQFVKLLLSKWKRK